MKIFFVSPTGTLQLEQVSNYQTLKEVCSQYGIPSNSISAYGKKGNDTKIFTGLHKTISEMNDEFESITIRPDRNIDYLGILNKTTLEKETIDSSAEYTFSDAQQPENNIHIHFTPDECQKFVLREVKKFVDQIENFDPDRKIVLGISGGGDSNMLIQAFLATGKVLPQQLQAVMMCGIPDWDLGRDRAFKIANDHNIPLRFVEASEVNKLLGRTQDSDWVVDFEKSYPDVDLEVLGTFGVRLSLEKVAKEIDAQAIVIGLNLEDILAEGIFQILKGELPLPYPVRTIKDTNIWYPLYKCPKKILDGCYPKYSLQNYMDRYQSKMPGRAIAYYLAQNLNSVIPGSEFDMINGLQKLSMKNQDFWEYDKDLNLPTMDPVSLKSRERWKQFCHG